ncbi:uncharacterized protein LACBIDRAFT_315741 [Laccaria bicolor S238N-H82]|uniref:Predicted protein n=1 Tax=Laccaria bicolor (strain S238N-H82 / ATCC MYA-4686) TaxID=486041 RepID=B0D322_LACBS|nr:uncharacterized protein LACBIDRAFT_315741 [Laccaria bicolor S238N-H82]EDR10847.1 predicted protein [Laccaria bicolor S238N-H82]|eukprot:XP_001878148.1 predicted protein [Laccaria bicolor S238N-H82]
MAPIGRPKGSKDKPRRPGAPKRGHPQGSTKRADVQSRKALHPSQDHTLILPRVSPSCCVA